VSRFILSSTLVLLVARAAAAQTPAPAPSPDLAPSTAPAAEPSPAPTTAPPRAPWTAGYKNGFTLQSETGDFVLKLTGYVQADGRFAAEDQANAVTDQFVLRRVRPIFQATVAQYFDVYVMPDFGGGTTVLQDAYLDVRFTPKLRFRLGKMKTPFGIERLQSAQGILFVERALPNNLVPNRDVGALVHGELAGGVVAYQAGVLNGVPDGGSVDTDTNDAKELAGRLFLSPWKTRYTSPLRGLGVGFAATRGTANGALRAYSSASQVAVFTPLTSVTASGDRTRISPQAYFYSGPVGVLAEYVRSSHDVQKVEIGRPTVNARLDHSAWSVTGSYLVTGEDASYATVKPKDFFVPSAGKWGAVQLVARVNRLRVDPDSFPVYADPTRSVRTASAWGVGVNWIWNSNLKYVVDYEQTRFEGGAAAGGDRPDEKSFQTRLHLAF
jgi:phosphate-selective porin OprO/OprP